MMDDKSVYPGGDRSQIQAIRHITFKVDSLVAVNLNTELIVNFEFTGNLRSVVYFYGESAVVGDWKDNNISGIVFLCPYALDIHMIRLIGRASQQSNNAPVPTRLIGRDNICQACGALDDSPFMVPLVTISFA
jgi:hypothetical protein